MTGLTNGTTYTFTVTATNAVGTGISSGTSNSVVPATTPGAPTSVSAVRGNGEATITFTAPADNGGSAITGYTVTSSPGGFTGTGGASPITVTGLTNGTSYTFTVTATNAVGTGSASSASSAVTPATVPDAPTNLAGTAGDSSVELYWTVPASNGGSAITSYTITSSPGGVASTSSTFPMTVIGLTNGTAYTFTIVATNAVGNSTASGASSSVTPAVVPGVPTNLAATPGDNSAALSWSAPASNGGSAITDYVVQYQLTTGGTWTTFTDGVGTTPATTVTGLANDNSYDFRVYAKNVIGQGSASDVASTTPGSPAQVLIQSFSDLIIPTIGTAVRITNEGSGPYEYQYTWCVTDSALNLCGGGNDVFSSSAAKLISAGTDFDTTLDSTVSSAGNYYFHISVVFGSDSSSANQSFTAVADTPVTPPVTSSSGGGGGGGGGGGAPAPITPSTSCVGADLSGDGKVNSVDFSIMLAFWKTSGPFKNGCVDTNNDKRVNSVDFSILLSQWGKSPALSKRN